MVLDGGRRRRALLSLDQPGVDQDEAGQTGTGAEQREAGRTIAKAKAHEPLDIGAPVSKGCCRRLDVASVAAEIRILAFAVADAAAIEAEAGKAGVRQLLGEPFEQPVRTGAGLG